VVLKPLTLDRFSQGLCDPQEAPVVATCAACGGEIYDGDLVYVIPGGDILHGDTECLVDYIGASLMSAEEVLGVGA